MKEDFGIYIHVPWCKRRCPYCNFYFKVGRPEPIYKDKILEEFSFQKQNMGYLPKAKSLYFGGGTPSVLGVDTIAYLVSYFKKEGYLLDNAEITLEANPEDITKSYLEDLSPFITRLSLGLQSLEDDILAFLGRKHRRIDILKTLDILQDLPEINISADLIIGVPNEDLNKLENNIKILHKNNINHISAYLLTIEENTYFSNKVSPDDDKQALAYEFVQNLLIDLDYKQYDISSYAKNGQFSIHNQIYWAKGSFLGLGPKAHSMKLLENGEVVRFSNETIVDIWLKRPVAKTDFVYEKLTKEEALRESLAFGLRNMHLGIDPKKLSLRHHTKIPKDFFLLIDNFIEKTWITKKDEKYFLTKKGSLMADGIMREILGLT